MGKPGQARFAAEYGMRVGVSRFDKVGRMPSAIRHVGRQHLARRPVDDRAIGATLTRQHANLGPNRQSTISGKRRILVRFLTDFGSDYISRQSNLSANWKAILPVIREGARSKNAGRVRWSISA
jgi:hypothetical protein